MSTARVAPKVIPPKGPGKVIDMAKALPRMAAKRNAARKAVT